MTTDMIARKPTEGHTETTTLTLVQQSIGIGVKRGTDIGEGTGIVKKTTNQHARETIARAAGEIDMTEKRKRLMSLVSSIEENGGLTPNQGLDHDQDRLIAKATGYATIHAHLDDNRAVRPGHEKEGDTPILQRLIRILSKLLLGHSHLHPNPPSARAVEVLSKPAP